jgi:hypothetical protein
VVFRYFQGGRLPFALYQFSANPVRLWRFGQADHGQRPDHHQAADAHLFPL